MITLTYTYHLNENFHTLIFWVIPVTKNVASRFSGIQVLLKSQRFLPQKIQGTENLRSHLLLATILRKHSNKLQSMSLIKVELGWHISSCWLSSLFAKAFSFYKLCELYKLHMSKAEHFCKDLSWWCVCHLCWRLSGYMIQMKSKSEEQSIFFFNF